MTADDARQGLQNHLDVFRAVERVEQLTGCLEDTPEEAELAGLVAALEDWLIANPYRK
ncbi:hypothetical protein [Bosea sp. BIWAKO-01]|uniref:hypothetical protein n=1 Tax=Bosea sp. BIWAKO-01 TaxID=506668 RepID=UPI0008699ED3|nr:hypothetical protein [Bosea sp. BIWAKO-01]GAU86694.1 hypothetical protein BIWAKO_06642 [Bosea sp. BIWAKO-01]